MIHILYASIITNQITFHVYNPENNPCQFKWQMSPIVAIFVLKPEDNPGWLDVAGEQVDPKIRLMLQKVIFFKVYFLGYKKIWVNFYLIFNPFIEAQSINELMVWGHMECLFVIHYYARVLRYCFWALFFYSIFKISRFISIFLP